MKITTIIGARPQFIKAAAVSRAIAQYNKSLASAKTRISETIIHTGQHFDDNMSEIFFRELQIPKPDINLGINSLSHGAMTGQMLEKLEELFVRYSPDWVLVYGDTNSTLAGALAAVKLHIPIVHVEAGLRSFNRKMPEEINRVLTDHMATSLFCPTNTAVDNLHAEGISKGIRNVGDVMFDAFLYYISLADQSSEILKKLKVEKKGYYLATLHREENTDDPDKLNSVLNAFRKIGTPDQPIIFPMHPRTQKKVNLDLEGFSQIRVISPIGYLDMIALESNAMGIFTDSGGIQKEAFFCRVPCITLRNETEWVETVESGWNCIAGCGTENIIAAYQSFEKRTVDQYAMPFGDGTAADKIIRELVTN